MVKLEGKQDLNIYVDIDETICSYDERYPREYPSAQPIYMNIAKINKLYDEGHTITYYTARGTVSGDDWHALTKTQFDKWGVKYHNLICGQKPAYDLMICDKTCRIEEL
jgi:hypothetical protein